LGEVLRKRMRESQKGCIEAEFSSCAGWWLWGLVQGKAGFNSPFAKCAKGGLPGILGLG
jgi:hypothetical protein